MSMKPVDTAIAMIVGPLIDDTDFKSLETAIAYNAAGMDLDLIVEKADGTTVKTDITPTTAGANDWTHRGNGYYQVEITAAQNAEEGTAYLVGFVTGVLPFRSVAHSVVATQVYNSIVKGSDLLDVTTDAASRTASKADVSTLESRLTAARAVYLDNLNAGGQIASQADIQGITQAQRVRVVTSPLYERPEPSGSMSYRIYIYAYDEQHKAENLDALPVVTVEDNLGVAKDSGKINTVTNPATGIYQTDYIVTDTDDVEGLLIKVAATEGGVTTNYVTGATVVDTTAVDYTAADRTKADTVYNDLVDGGRLDLLIDAILAASQTLTVTERSAIADAVLSRDMANVEASATEHSLCYVVLAASESNTTANAGMLTVFRVDGATEFAQKPITTDAAASPITGVS